MFSSRLRRHLPKVGCLLPGTFQECSMLSYSHLPLRNKHAIVRAQESRWQVPVPCTCRQMSGVQLHLPTNNSSIASIILAWYLEYESTLILSRAIHQPPYPSQKPPRSLSRPLPILGPTPPITSSPLPTTTIQPPGSESVPLRSLAFTHRLRTAEGTPPRLWEETDMVQGNGNCAASTDSAHFTLDRGIP